MVRHFRHFVRRFFRHFEPSNGGASTLPTLFLTDASRGRARTCESLFFSVGSVGSVGNINKGLIVKGNNFRHFFRHIENGVFQSVGGLIRGEQGVNHG